MFGGKPAEIELIACDIEAPTHHGMSANTAVA